MARRRKPDLDEINRMQRELALPDSQWGRERGATNSSTFQVFAGKWQEANDDGLMAAAFVARDRLRAKLRRGYTRGRFVTGRAAAAVKVGKPFTGREKGDRMVRVVARIFYAGFWEFGAFIRGRFRRVTHFEDTQREAGPEMATAFHQAFQSRLNQLTRSSAS